MRSYLSAGVVFILVSIFIYNDSVYEYSLEGMAGGTKQLSEYSGRNILIVTLPSIISEANQAQLQKLDSLYRSKASELSVIAVPSFEDGFSSQNKSDLAAWYRSLLDSNIFLSDGVYVRKTSTNEQHPLFQWLTQVEKNGNFNLDVQKPFDKFIINKHGELVAVLGSYISFSSVSLNRVLAVQ